MTHFLFKISYLKLGICPRESLRQTRQPAPLAQESPTAGNRCTKFQQPLQSSPAVVQNSSAIRKYHDFGRMAADR